MLELKRLLKADMIKLKSTHIIWFHLYIPLIGLIGFLTYYSNTSWASFSKISGYLQVLSMVFPILIGIITSMVVDQEYESGNFQHLLSSTERKELSFISKLILSLLLGTLSTILAVVGFYIGFNFIEGNTLPLTMFLAVVGILIGSNIILYIFHFFLSLRFSKAVSIGVGIIESLVSALFLTGMGDGRWPFMPCTWSMRFVSSLLIKYENVNIFDPDLSLGIVLSIVGTIAFFLIMVLWFRGWEGKKAEE